jgi:glycosyltransferase involved in cell wall biosynthesis
LAFINPQEEDFGITVVESMAAGRPVIAYERGGATETVVNGKTGLFFNESTPESLASAIRSFSSESFNPQEIRNYAEKFSVDNFKEQLLKFISERQKEFKI